MQSVRYPALPGSPSFGDLADPAEPVSRRLAVAIGISAVAIAVAILTIDLAPLFHFARRLPLVLDVTLRERPEERGEEPAAPLPSLRAAEPQAAGERRDTPAAPERQAAAGVAESAEADAPPAAAALPAPATIDWYTELEDAAAEIGERYATPDSLHPEFDELRRIARARYGKPQTGAPASPWQEPEKDVYGRTILRRGNCFQVLDDENLGNRYAFETFERHLFSCGFSFGRQPPENLPWVEVIQEKYPHLRDRDGSEASAAAEAARKAGD